MAASCANTIGCDEGLVANAENNAICEADVCGNGNVTTEACDDGNDIDGDGCSASCEVEDGFLCGQELQSSFFGPIPVGPSLCIASPGADWTCTYYEASSEECDCGCGMQDPACADGTSASCDAISGCFPEGVESLADITTVPDASENSVCVANQCGDGFAVESEVCDDGNTVDGDGCSADCTTVEDGFACNGVIVQECIQLPAEWTCDGSFYGVDDGCDCGCGAVDPDCADATRASCEFINGCFPDDLPEDATPADVNSIPDMNDNSMCVDNTCGDGFAVGADACDDGNTTDGDGCSATCTVEDGFACELGENFASVCTAQ